ncbi:50S ribosomal protein L11 methyltransferase [Patiriisocius hiemis]|uniref:Ribosomal protein L11 methyltransferase n=1 Tax=Patiriisocius hiemis TaxID=3075604 RepID=A0ABU2YDP4_9FLAO|nr:50S ribosomal protein L11 methyltransferase [Constantimarinum sp. W242]MDT0555915.1 50S ribosomal protein L11 methyltransferase [Constantimarinum sp. W242]
MTNYIEYTFIINPLHPGTEILIAELGSVGFESFVENEKGIAAYIQKTDWTETVLEDIYILKSNEFEISFSKKEIEQVNWNQEWEKNFTPIEVDGSCVVRAPFHKTFNVDFEIVIEPKMSFGTGHHETTFMMLQYILENKYSKKSVLDMGCGTAVLAILAKMKGATQVDAIDIDDWCVENSIENCNRNGCEDVNVILGDKGALPNKPKYHTIIANINRNILLNDMNQYVKSLKEKGEVYLSGFYLEDLSIIKNHCNTLGLTFVSNKESNNWVAAKFVY